MSFDETPAPPNSPESAPIDAIYVGGPGMVPPLEQQVREPPVGPQRRRRVLLPVALFLATCVSMCLAWGVTPVELNVAIPMAVLRAELPDSVTIVSLGPKTALLINWREGLIYMAAGITILLAHEMGHFVQALRYGVPASLPYFIPMPLPPIGTMGAVIGMRSSVANRKQMFDIGLTGPLAGLLVALPVCWVAILNSPAMPLDAQAVMHYQDPLLFKAMMWYLRPDLLPGQELTATPLLMAGWMAMLITGLNMLPVSQLDGGHVAYSLFGRHAFRLTWLVIAAAIAFILITQQFTWVLMLFVIIFVIGPYHPPTADDTIPLGWGRRLLGIASLTIPIFCFMPEPISRPQRNPAPQQRLRDGPQQVVLRADERILSVGLV